MHKYYSLRGSVFFERKLQGPVTTTSRSFNLPPLGSTHHSSMPSTTELATRPTISSDPYRGLIWAEETFGPEAQWTYEPEISAIERAIQSLRPLNTT